MRLRFHRHVGKTTWGLSAQRDHGGEAGGLSSPRPGVAVPARRGGHHGAAVGRHLQVPARHELLLVEEMRWRKLYDNG